MCLLFFFFFDEKDLEEMFIYISVTYHQLLSVNFPPNMVDYGDNTFTPNLVGNNHLIFLQCNSCDCIKGKLLGN